MPRLRYDFQICSDWLKADYAQARGLMSGILQQGYSMGYVFAACANLGVGGSVESWKTVFGENFLVAAHVTCANVRASTYRDQFHFPDAYAPMGPNEPDILCGHRPMTRNIYHTIASEVYKC